MNGNTTEKDAPDYEQAYRRAVSETELTGGDYQAALGSKDPDRIRVTRETFKAAADREYAALTALVESRRRVTFADLLNDPMQQLDTEGIVFQRVIAADTACACTDPKCPRHYRPIPPGNGGAS